MDKDDPAAAPNLHDAKCDTSQSSAASEDTSSPRAPYALHEEETDSGEHAGSTKPQNKSSRKPHTSEAPHSVRAPYAQPVLDASKLDKNRSSVEERIASAKERRLQQQKQIELEMKMRRERENQAHAKWMQSQDEKRRKLEDNRLKEEAHRKEVELRKKQQLEEEKRKAEAKIAKTEQQCEVKMRQKRSVSSDRGSKRWSWGAGGAGKDKRPSSLHASHFDVSRLGKFYESNEPKSSSQANLSSAGTTKDRFSRNPVNTSHLHFASGLRSYDSKENLKGSDTPNRRSNSMGRIPVTQTGAEYVRNNRGRSPAPRKKSQDPGTSSGRPASSANLLDPVQISPRLLAPTRASLARSRQALNEPDPPTEGPMRSRSKDRRAAPRSARSPGQPEASKSTKQRGVSPSPRWSSLTAPTAASQARSQAENAEQQTRPKRGVSPQTRRTPSPKPSAPKRSPSPNHARARPRPSAEQHKTNETSKPPNIKPMLKPNTDVRSKFKAKPREEAKKQISDKQTISKPTVKESEVSVSTATEKHDDATPVEKSDAAENNAAKNPIPNKVRFADHEQSGLEIVESEVEIAAGLGFRLEPTSRSSSPTDSLEEIQDGDDEEKENFEEKPESKQVWNENKENIKPSDDSEEKSEETKQNLQVEDFPEAEKPQVDESVAAEEPQNEADADMPQEPEAVATEEAATDLEDAVHADVEATNNDKQQTPLEPEAPKLAWQEHEAATNTRLEDATLVKPEPVAEENQLQEDATPSALEATNKTGQEDEVPANAWQEEAAPNTGQETDEPLEPEAAENATREAETDLGQETDKPEAADARQKEETPVAAEATADVGQEGATAQKPEATEKKTQPRKSLETDEAKEAYRRAIAEKRKEAKEKKEQEEREKQERMRLSKIEQLKREEEARKMFEEAAKAAEIAKREQEEREEEERKREEEGRKREEEANAKKREIAEQQRKRQEDERLARKKRLEMIMRRTRQPDGDSKSGNDDGASLSANQSPVSGQSPRMQSPVEGRSSTTPERCVSPSIAAILNRSNLEKASQVQTPDEWESLERVANGVSDSFQISNGDKKARNSHSRVMINAVSKSVRLHGRHTV